MNYLFIYSTEWKHYSGSKAALLRQTLLSPMLRMEMTIAFHPCVHSQTYRYMLSSEPAALGHTFHINGERGNSFHQQHQLWPGCETCHWWKQSGISMMAKMKNVSGDYFGSLFKYGGLSCTFFSHCKTCACIICIVIELLFMKILIGNLPWEFLAVLIFWLAL